MVPLMGAVHSLWIWPLMCKKPRTSPVSLKSENGFGRSRHLLHGIMSAVDSLADRCYCKGSVCVVPAQPDNEHSLH